MEHEVVVIVFIAHAQFRTRAYNAMHMWRPRVRVRLAIGAIRQKEQGRGHKQNGKA